jgi:prephenate dehydrogenase
VKTVAIVGTGLIGGSFALALREAGFSGRIAGVSSPGAIREALARGVIEEEMTLAGAAAGADLLYLAQPIGRILRTLKELGAQARAGALITDAGSTKREIVAAAERLLPRGTFLGGHPMAGKESRGVESADAGLFRGFPYVLTPSDEEMLNSGIAQEFVWWLRRIGADVQVMTPAEHDRLVAGTSHLPQLLATALARTLADLEGAERTAGPALRDMTRIASSSFEVWRDILATNPDAIRDVLRRFRTQLDEAERRVGLDSMEELFRQAAEGAQRWRRS